MHVVIGAFYGGKGQLAWWLNLLYLSAMACLQWRPVGNDMPAVVAVAVACVAVELQFWKRVEVHFGLLICNCSNCAPNWF